LNVMLGLLKKTSLLYCHVHVPIGLVKISIFYLSFFPQLLPNRVKIKYHLNPKIHNSSCVYTSIDNEAWKKSYSIKILEWKTVKTVGIGTATVLSSKNCKVFIAQKHLHSLFRFNWWLSYERSVKLGVRKI
jgi:hypothetical protein